MAKILLIHGTTRPSRLGLTLTRTAEDLAREVTDLEISVADLAEIDLPFLMDSKHPKAQDYDHEHTKAWSRTVADADAFVWVTSEYNGGYPAPLKNAIDHLYKEWQDKPLGILSYGAGRGGGSSAAGQLVQVAERIGMNVVGEPVTFPQYPKALQEDGTLDVPGQWREDAAAVLEQLASAVKSETESAD